MKQLELNPCYLGYQLPMKLLFRCTFTFLSFLALSLSAYSQSTPIIYGFVSDSLTGQTLPGASVYLNPGMVGGVTDIDGGYTIKAEPGNYTLVASYIGFREIKRQVNLEYGDSIRFDIELGSIMLKQVEIEATRLERVESVEMGVNALDIATIETMPAFLGEVDLLKSIQLLPGVQSAGEGSAGFYVRGGGPDQNLILFDDAVVYNASHLLGFFSVFNSDAIQSVKLYKGVMPARFGERLASVIEIDQRQGNLNEFAAKGGIGLISSRLTVEGPIKKGESSFLISGRRTYIDALARPFINSDSPFGGSGYYFYDLNGRLDWKLKGGGNLFLSGYLGDDYFNFDSPESEFKTTIGWGNRILSGGYSKLYKNNSLLKINGSVTNYEFRFLGTQDDFQLEVKSNILDYRFKPEYSFSLGSHRIRFGGLYTFHTIRPNNSEAEQGSTQFDLGKQQEYYSQEGALYLSDAFDLTDVWRIEAGLRASAFMHLGPFTRYILDESGNKTDTINYQRASNIADYFGLEPRFNVRYTINDKSSIKAAFTQNYQYIHLANISPLALPTDVWLPSTDIVKPQLGRQYSIGYFRNFLEGTIEASVEAYYKTMDNLVEYKENTQPSDGVDNNEDNLLTFGSGEAYGIELFIKKSFGKTTGWIGYTLSRSERTFEEINQGRTYPATFDRTHDLAVVVSHKLNKKWTLSSNFVYGTGRAITLPQSGYFIENRLVYNYANRNSFRMKDYHRLDLSAIYQPANTKTVIDPKTGEKKEVSRKIQSKWVFSIYNVYSRLNPYFYYFDSEGRVADNTFKVTAKQVSLFPILPSVTWNFTF